VTPDLTNTVKSSGYSLAAGVYGQLSRDARLPAALTRALRVAGDLAHLTLSCRTREGRTSLKRERAFDSLRGHAESVTFDREDIKWTAPVGDKVISRILFASGEFQADEQRALLRWMKAHDYLTHDKTHVVDVGANIGTTCIPLAKHTGKSVIALEPDPANYEYLQRNVERNGLRDQITCLKLAASNQACRMKMLVNPNSAGSTQIVEGDMEANASETVEVETDALDNILKSQGISPQHVAFVWSDTEGYERYVIEGGKSLWAADVPAWVEFFPPALKNHGGLDKLIMVVQQYFGNMVLSEELKVGGNGTKIHPTANLVPRMILDVHGGYGTDILLINAASRSLSTPSPDSSNEVWARRATWAGQRRASRC
jgi:FkbM family methyltransferase